MPYEKLHDPQRKRQTAEVKLLLKIPTKREINLTPGSQEGTKRNKKVFPKSRVHERQLRNHLKTERMKNEMMRKRENSPFINLCEQRSTVTDEGNQRFTIQRLRYDFEPRKTLK